MKASRGASLMRRWQREVEEKKAAMREERRKGEKGTDGRWRGGRGDDGGEGGREVRRERWVGRKRESGEVDIVESLLRRAFVNRRARRFSRVESVRLLLLDTVSLLEGRSVQP